MIKLRNTKFEEFIELVEFLTLTEKTEDEEGRIFGITMKLSRFFPKLSAMNTVQLGNLVDSIYRKDNETARNLFHEMGDFDFDPEGRNDINLSYKSIPGESVDILLNNAKSAIKADGKDLSKHKVHTQIIDALELKCLDNISITQDYTLHKISYLKFNNNPMISKDDFLKYESICEWFGDNNNTVMNKVITYIEKKKPENCKIFLQHFLLRLELAHDDYELENENNKIFIENLKRIAK